MGRRGGFITSRCLVPARAGNFISPAYHGPGNEDLVGASNADIDDILEEFIYFLFACEAYPLFPCVEDRVFEGSDSVHRHLEDAVCAEGCAAHTIFCGNFSVL